MKNRLALLLTILLMSGLWSFAQVAPEPQPGPQPIQPRQPQPPTQPRQAQPPATPAPADVIELRLDDENNARKVEMQRVYADQMAKTAYGFTAKVKTEKGSYIGIATSPLPQVVREQLKLPSGSGLVVDRVEPESPAETAGVKAYDVLQKLDDQVLINPHQFGVLVRQLKPDVEAKLLIIREAKPQTIAVRPIVKDLAPIDEAAAYGDVRPWREGNTANLTRFGGGGGKYTLTATPKPETGAVDFMTAIDRTEMVTDNGKTKITTTIGPKGDRWACVVDKATDKVIFNGAIDTDEQRQALPKDVQDQLKQLDQMKLTAPMGIKAVPMPGRNGQANIFFDRVAAANAKNGGGARNNLPKCRSVSGSDDDYTWEFTTKIDENGSPELELLLLDKNGKILFQGPFSRSRDTRTLPGPVAERLSTFPWKDMIDDLKGTGNAGINVKFAPGQNGFGGAPGAGAPPAGGGGNLPPVPRRPAK